MTKLEKEAMDCLEKLMNPKTPQHPGQLDMARELVHCVNSSLGRWLWNKRKSMLAKAVDHFNEHWKGYRQWRSKKEAKQK